MTDARTPEEILARAREIVAQGERAYEQFLETWGIDRAAVERAAKGDHIASPERRRRLALAVTQLDLPDEPARTAAAMDSKVPPHAIRC